MDDVSKGAQTSLVAFVSKLHHCSRFYVMADGRRLMVSNTFKEAVFLTLHITTFFGLSILLHVRIPICFCRLQYSPWMMTSQRRPLVFTDLLINYLQLLISVDKFYCTSDDCPYHNIWAVYMTVLKFQLLILSFILICGLHSLL